MTHISNTPGPLLRYGWITLTSLLLPEPIYSGEGQEGLPSGWRKSASALEWRELETDRPDATESPVTVDAGLWQVEAGWFSHTRDQTPTERVRSWTFGEVNLKYGITPRVDAQLVLQSYVRETRTTSTGSSTAQGMGDPVIRLKTNLWGNEEGRTAVGLLPHVKIPTSTPVSNGHWEGGLAVPMAWRGGERWSLGGQVQIDRVYDENRGTFEASLFHTLVLGLDVAGPVGIYLEYVGTAGSHPYQAQFSSGCTVALGEFLVLDFGTLVGLNQAAEDLTVFSGISLKF